MLKDIINIEYDEYYHKSEAMERTIKRVKDLQVDDVSCEVSIDRMTYNNIISYGVTIIVRDASMPNFDVSNLQLPTIKFPNF